MSILDYSLDLWCLRYKREKVIKGRLEFFYYCLVIFWEMLVCHHLVKLPEGEQILDNIQGKQVASNSSSQLIQRLVSENFLHLINEGINGSSNI